MRRLNPDTALDAAKDAGMAAVLAVPAAAGVGLLAYGATKIDYPVAAGDMLTPMQKRAGIVALGSLVVGALMQMSKTTEKVGLGIVAIGVGAPLAAVVAEKVGAMSAPAAATQPLPAAATQPLLAAPSSGMWGYGRSGNLMGANSPFLNPSGFAADNYGPFAPTGELSSSIQSPAYIPPAR